MADAKQVFDEIVSAVAEAQQKESDKLVDSLKYKVSVPVQYVTGPRGGVRVIRSKPGEPPRKETGRLQASIESETIEAGDQVASAVTVSVPYALPLQEQMDRPITDDELQQVEDAFLDSIVAAIEG